MAEGIDIHPDVVSGLVPILRSPEALHDMHVVAERSNPFFRIAHAFFVVNLNGGTQYDSSIVSAISTGIEAYEVLGVNCDPIPVNFGLSVIANFEQNPNYCLAIADTMQESMQALFQQSPQLADGLREICQAHTKGLNSELFTYSLGGASLMRAAHKDADMFWHFERDLAS